MGPAPKITTESPGRTPVRFTAWRETAMGSLMAAMSNGTWSGTTARFRFSSAFSIFKNSDSPPKGPPLPVCPAAMGLTTTWSPTAMPWTCAPTSTTSPAGSWPSGVAPCRGGMPP